MTERRLASVLVTDALVETVFKSGTRCAVPVDTRLPDDAQLAGASYDGRHLVLTFRSEAFQVLSDGDDVPYLEAPMFKTPDDCQRHIPVEIAP